MKILFILQYVPYPLNCGGNQGVFNMIDKIRKEHEVSIAFYIDNKESLEAQEQLRNIWDDITFYPFFKKEKKEKEENEYTPNTISFRICNYLQKSFTRKVNRRIRKHCVETSDFIRANSCLNNEFPTFEEGYKEHIYQIARKGFDIIQVEFYESLPLVYLLPENVTKIFVQHEIRYVRNKNEMDLFKKQTAEDIYRWNLLKDMELKALSHYDNVVALTENDKVMMHHEDPSLNIYVSPLVISQPTHKFTYRQPAKELVFVGSGDHFPNADGLLWFCQEVMPLIRRQCDVKVNIVGKWREKEKTAMLTAEPSLNFTGYIDDLGKFLNGKISVVPIRIGSGMRMKLLDSAIAASPVVTTSKGCEGLPFASGKNCLIADTPSEFADAVVKMIGNQDNIQEMFVRNAMEEIPSIVDANRQIQRRLELYNEIAQTKKIEADGK